MKKVMVMMMVIGAVIAGGNFCANRAERLENEIGIEIRNEAEERRIEKWNSEEEAGESIVWTSDWHFVAEEADGKYYYAYDCVRFDVKEETWSEFTVYDIYNDCMHAGTLYSYT